MNDDLIQKLLDENGDLSPDSDVNAYKQLYDYLDNTKSFEPSPGFAHRVSASIDLHHKQRSFGILIPVLAGGLVLLAASIGLIFYLNLSFVLNGPTRMLIIMFFTAIGLNGIYRLFVRKADKTQSHG